MEYPPLVAGQPALFAVHLTKLADFTPVTAGRPRVEFTPESGGAAEVARRAAAVAARARFASRRRRRPPGRYRWALVLEAPGLSDRHDLGTITVFADEQAARRRRREAARRRRRGHRVSEGAAVDQRVRDGAGAGSGGAHVDSRAGHGASAAGRRSDRRRASGRPVHAPRRCCRLATASAPGQVLGRLEPRLSAGRRSRDARSRSRRSAGRCRSRARRAGRAPNGCWPSAPCRRAGSRTRVAPRRRRGAIACGRSPTRATRRNAAHGRRRRRGQRVRAARAHRRTAGRGDGDAGRVLRRRRAAVPDRADRSRRTGSPGAGGRRRRRRGRRPRSRSRFPASPSRSRSKPTTCTIPA